MVIKDKSTGEIIGRVITGHSMTFDEAMEFAGFEWRKYPDVECDGWYDPDGILWDESTAEMDYNE